MKLIFTIEIETDRWHPYGQNVIDDMKIALHEFFISANIIDVKTEEDENQGEKT